MIYRQNKSVSTDRAYVAALCKRAWSCNLLQIGSSSGMTPGGLPPRYAQVRLEQPSTMC
jgi:hypothetical protein